MPSMPGRIAKGSLLRKIETWLNQDPTNPVKALQELATGNPLVQVLTTLGIPLSTAEQTHLKQHWFGDAGTNTPPGWWQSYQPIERVVRQGFVEACGQMLADGGFRPIDCYWVCHGGICEVWVAESAQQITVTIVTPPPPTFGFELPTKENIVIVRNTWTHGHQVENQTAEDVQTLRLMGL